MSDIAKWALLAAAVVTLIITVLTFPFVQYLPNGTVEITQMLTNIMQYITEPLYTARAFINLFLLPVGRNILSGLIVYFFTSWIVKITIKITAWIFHFIFK